ncbi:MAG: hypothetical protein KIH89_004160, partial [Candidatus Shapirobacteria bacterium]|nr:hypothetical protein [Candidatus Shapirobacteria bacterium]
MNIKKFSVFLTSFIGVALIASVWIVKNENFDIRRKAAEEKQTIPVSRWVPIKLDEMNQVIDEQINTITSKNGSVGSLDRSLKIQNVIKRNLASMDTKKDNEIDYKEFNANIINLSKNVYNLRHSLDETKAKGLYAVNSATGNQKNILRIIVEAGIYN